MSKKQVAIIGAGIVGSTVAYFLSQDSELDVTVFDEGTGQGTAASAGIISPWLSRRRNKKWYRMVRKGAAFYPSFLSDVMQGEKIPSSVYKKVGTLLFKSKPEYLQEMLEIGLKRREEAPEIGELSILSKEEVKEKISIYTGEESALWASGGARVDGKEIVDLLLDKAQENGVHLIKEQATLTQQEDKYSVQSNSLSKDFDEVVLAVAAWLPDLLNPLNYDVDIRPQKGQLVELQLEDIESSEWPVIMPEGEKDIIPFEEGKVIIGATHEGDAGFNLKIDSDLLEPMINEAVDEFSSFLSTAKVHTYRSGTRAYTSDYAPFFGEVPGAKGLYAASGLGATGLTAGPLVGKVLSELVLKQETSLPLEDYSIENYVKLKG